MNQLMSLCKMKSNVLTRILAFKFCILSCDHRIEKIRPFAL